MEPKCPKCEKLKIKVKFELIKDEKNGNWVVKVIYCDNCGYIFNLM